MQTSSISVRAFPTFPVTENNQSSADNFGWEQMAFDVALIELDGEAGDRAYSCREKNQSVLDLSRCDMRHIPDNLFPALANLTGLNLSGNSLQGLPSDISQLESLEILDLSDNSLQELPSQLTSLKSLNKLDLRGNVALSIPADIQERFPGVEILVDKNQVSASPTSVDEVFSTLSGFVKQAKSASNLNGGKRDSACLESDSLASKRSRV